MAEGEVTPFRITDDVKVLLRGRREASPDDFATFVDDSAADAASDERSALRWSSTINEESATWLGTWVDIGESNQFMTFTTCIGTRHTLQITMVGPDVVLGKHADGTTVVIALSAVEIVGSPSRRAVSGDRKARGESLQGVLFQMAGERPNISVRMFSGTMISGELLSVGVDVLSIRSDSNVSAIALPHIAEVIRHGR